MFKKQKYIVFLIFVLIVFSNNIRALNNKISKDNLLEKADYLYSTDAFDNSITLYNQLLKLLYDKKSTTYAKTLVGLGKCYAMKGNYDIALNYFTKAENTITKSSINCLEIYKDILARKGNILVVVNKSSDAIATLNKLLSLKANDILHQDRSLISVYEDIGIAYLHSSKINTAIVFFNKELELSFKWKDDNSTYNSLYKIADCYFTLTDYNKSMEFLNKAQKLITKDNKDNLRLASLYLKKGQIKSNIRDYISANNFYNDVEKMYNNAKSKDIAMITYLYSNKGINYYYMGDYDKALLYYDKVLNLYSSDASNKYLSEISNVNHNIGNVYLSKKDYTKAIYYYSRCIDYNKHNNTVQLADNYNSIAIAYKRNCNLALSSKNYLLAINSRLKYSSAKNIEIAKDYLNYGELLIEMNKNSEAFNMLMKSYTIFKDSYRIKHPNLSSCLTTIGNYYLKINKPEKALDYYQDAIIAIVDNFNCKDIKTNPSSINYPSIELLNALKCKANVLNILSGKNKNKVELLKNSFNTYNLAISLISRINNSYSNDESKLFIAENEKQTYTNALEVSEKLFKLTNEVSYISSAYQFAEQSKASVVLSNLRESNAINYGDIPTSLKVNEQNIKNDISANEKLLYSEQSSSNPDQNKINKLKNKIFDLEQQKDKLISSFEINYKSYNTLKYSDKVIDIKTVQSKLKEKESVIEYVLSDKTIFTFLISKNFYNLYSQKIDTDFNNNIDFVRKYNSTNTYGNSSIENYKAYTTAAYSIYKKILQPIESYIRWNHLIIVPDEKLNLISFETLLDKPLNTSDINFSKLPYLILEHPISYSYSTTILYNGYNNNINSIGNKVLAFAPDYKNINTNLYASVNYRNELSNLKNTKEETSKISNLMHGTVVQDNLATKSNFLSMAKDYDILHLAMHAVIDDENPMYSKLVFAQNQKGNEDVMLNTGDIYNLHLNSKLVVLSACNTGNGQIRKGEGVMSLARAFFYAGCPSVVMTLWSVEDKASSNLMCDFYKYISKGYSKDKAMQLAKIDYLQNNPPSKTHPFYWAGYVAIGDDSPLFPEKENNNPNYAYLLLIAGVGIGLTAPFFTNRRLNRKLKRSIRIIKYYFIH